MTAWVLCLGHRRHCTSKIALTVCFRAFFLDLSLSLSLFYFTSFHFKTYAYFLFVHVADENTTNKQTNDE